MPELMTRLRLVQSRSQPRAMIIDFVHCMHCDYTGVKVGSNVYVVA